MQKIVTTTEAGFREVLGEYIGTDEDAVLYSPETGGVTSAPVDCVRVETVPFTDNQKQFLGVVNVILDVPDQTAAEAVMEWVVRRLQDAAIQRGQLLADLPINDIILAEEVVEWPS
jgi:hypothetical protein